MIFAMSILHATPDCLESIVEYRRSTGAGRLDECWEGVWHLTDPTSRHQRTASRIYRVHAEIVEDARRGTAWSSINITDRATKWIDNHRCPDGAVILNGNPGRWIGENAVAFLGGPDLVVEVASEGDDTLLKLPFFQGLGVREILIVDVATGEPELWRLGASGYQEVAGSRRSEVTGLEYTHGSEGLEIRDPASGKVWKI
jgi:Uma2 family endonuclease